MPASNYLRNKLYDHTLGKASWTMPTTVYVALYTSDPTAADVGTEVSGGGYARQALTMGVATNGVGANSAAVDFGTASASWGTITHAGIRDALTTGNLLIYDALDVPRTVASGDTFDIPIGDVDITFS